MKKNYTAPNIDILVFDEKDDVILTSGTGISSAAQDAASQAIQSEAGSNVNVYNVEIKRQ